MKYQDKLEEAFILGFLNKQADAGLEKEAFLPALLNIGTSILGTVGGGILGQHLARKLAPGIAQKAKAQLYARTGARISGPQPRSLKAVAGLPESESFSGRTYDNVLRYLADGSRSRNLADNMGSVTGGILGGVATTPFMVKEV